jgi:hypothetical protein
MILDSSSPQMGITPDSAHARPDYGAQYGGKENAYAVNELTTNTNGGTLTVVGTTTSPANHIFERIRETWPNTYVHFVLVYRCAKNVEGIHLKWCKAASSSTLTHEQYDEIAARYHEIAMQSYVRNKNLIIRDNSPNNDSKTKKFYGLLLPQKPKPLPANSLGQRWWRFVIGSGAVRNAGFVLVARIAAVDSKEIKSHIERIQSIVGESSQ